ncbi:MAG: hypothetical protein K2H86_01230, partial [Muribaculaceae bacterium]|nr:hypothetical protein [Muribaculaceae bacterium]
PEWRIHSCISPDFIGGKMVAVRSMVADCRFSYEQPSNEPVMCAEEGPIDMVSIVPSQMVYVLDHPDMFTHVKRYLIGGSPLPLGMKDLIKERGLEVWESYGMTESASHIAVRHVADNTLFMPLPGIDISCDERSCLVIKGVSESDIVTNDIVEITDKNKFKVIGRHDNVIITGGRKVNPEWLEDMIASITGIKHPMLVAGIPDEKWGNRIVLYIEGAQMNADEARMMMSKMRDSLEPWQCPKEIYYVDTLARTPNGKIIRKTASEPDRSGSER